LHEEVVNAQGPHNETPSLGIFMTLLQCASKALRLLFKLSIMEMEPFATAVYNWTLKDDGIRDVNELYKTPHNRVMREK
jgi:hypothetical protein